jgi:predicted enzyme related to lactoylglutathione lyase
MPFAFRNVAIDCNDLERMTEFWSAMTGFEKVWGNDQYNFLQHPDGRRPGIVMQKVPEPVTAKTRIHVDLDAVAAEDEGAAIQEAVDLGATVVAQHHELNVNWTVLNDPEGNVFCIQTSNP